MSAEIGSYIRHTRDRHCSTAQRLQPQILGPFPRRQRQKSEKALVEAKERYLKVYNNREEFRSVREWKSSQPAAG